MFTQAFLRNLPCYASRAFRTTIKPAVAATRLGGKVIRNSIPHNPTIGVIAAGAGAYAKAQALPRAGGLLTRIVVANTMRGFANPFVGRIFAEMVVVPAVVPSLISPFCLAVGAGIALGTTWAGNLIAAKMAPKTPEQIDKDWHLIQAQEIEQKWNLLEKAEDTESFTHKEVSFESARELSAEAGWEMLD